MHTQPQRYVAGTDRLQFQTPVISAKENGGQLDPLVGQQLNVSRKGNLFFYESHEDYNKIVQQVRSTYKVTVQ